MFAETTGRPAQFSALHFHQIVWVNNVVDVAAHPGTSQETLSLIRTFAKRIGQVPIVLKKESPFYLFNAMLRALCDEAIKLALNNVASVEDIDRAWIGITKMPFGPFGILDTIGLDLAWEVESYWGKILDSSQMQKNAEFIKDYVDKGHLGVKSGQGFYTYPNPAYRQAGFVAGE
jgi:3-hydroxybutyryl-CoA dehydrogenase